MVPTRRHFPPRFRGPLLLPVAAALALVLVWGAAGPVQARLVKDRASGDDTGARRVFALMTEAWVAGDARAMADLVHPDGLSVTSGPSAARHTQYSPSQAFYYFKNLFQSHETIAFRFDKVQGGGEGPRAHGMASWERRRAGQGREQVVRLMCVLVRVEGDWKLMEIHTIR